MFVACGCVAFFLWLRDNAVVAATERAVAVKDGNALVSVASETQDPRLNDLIENARQARQSVELASGPPVIVALMADLENFVSSEPDGKVWTREEIDHLKVVFMEFLEVKAAYERQLVKVVSANANSIEFEVTPYPEAGAELKRLFQKEVSEGLDNGTVLAPSVRAFIEHHFAHFGATTQRIRVATTTDPTLGRLYAITHSLYATGYLQREAGGVHGGFVSSTSSSMLAPAQLFEGSYAHIADAVAKHFGDTRPTG